jgi:hypothetical protein
VLAEVLSTDIVFKSLVKIFSPVLFESTSMSAAFTQDIDRKTNTVKTINIALFIFKLDTSLKLILT